MKKKLKNLRGITAVELVLALLLTTMVAGIAIQVLRSSADGLHFTMDETKLQTDARLFAAEVNNNVRYATATFTIPKSSFRADNLTPDWNYMGVMDNVTIPAERSHTGESFVASKALVSILAQDEDGNPKQQPEDNLISVAGGTFVQRILGYSYTDPDTGREIEYDIVFDKENPEKADQKVKYSLRTTLKMPGTPERDYLSYDTALETLNSLQIIHKGSDSNPSVAIAYRHGEKSVTTALVSMILDTSGSMKWNMAGKDTNIVAQQRITILKNTANNFVDGLAASENVNIGLFPFGGVFKPEIYGTRITDVTAAKVFRSSKNDTALLHTRINSLSADGGTNTGDAIRFAYYRAKEYQSSLGPTQKCEHYFIILIDGETNGWSNNASKPMVHTNINYYTADGVHFVNGTKNYQYAGGYSPTTTFQSPYPYNSLTYGMDKGEAYMGKFASSVASLKPKIFFIVVSDNVSSRGVEAVKRIYSIPNSNTFIATDSSKLSEAFEAIQNSIKDDLWYLNGPQL